MKFGNAFKIGVVCFAFALALHDGAWAQIPEHDITVGRTINVPGPSGLVYRDDGFWVISWNIREGTRLRHYSADRDTWGTELGNYAVPEVYLVQALAWDGTHWWIVDNIHPSGDKIKKCELTSTGLNVLKEYIWPGPGSGPAAIEWAQGYLWLAENFTDIIYRVTVRDTSLISVTPWSSGNISPYGLAWDGTNMWSSCSPAGSGTSGPREIYKHDADGNIIEIWRYPGADGPPPGTYGGCAMDIAFAGNQLWYCDYDKNQIIEAIRGAGTGLVAYYPFNGNANDESGNGNHGSLIGGATWTTGVLDGAVHLDGTGYINVPDSSSLDLPVGSGTIAAFIKVDPSTDQFGVVAKESSSSYASTIAYEFLVRPDHESSVISDGTTCNYGLNSGGADLRDSLWHHIALSWSGPGGEILIYRDGVQVFEGNQTISTINNISEPVFIGAFRWNVPPGILRKMTGDIDEVRIYNRALSANEISELAGITESTEGWIAFGSNRDGDLDIWAVRPDGSDLRQITNLPGAEFTPQWSPDSTKIAYATATDAQIWVYDWFAGTNTKIFDGDDYGGMYYAAEPAWSPDGKRILFQGQTTYNNPHIAMINADGSGRRTIVPIEGGYVSGASWCPSGTAFVYSRRNSGLSYTHDLWIYDFTSTGDITNGVNHRLTEGAGSESTTKNYPDWTPSGKILFTWGHNLVLIDPGQSPNWNGPISSPSDPHITFLTNDASYPSIVYSYPSWSPYLSQIVYADESAATGTYDIWIIDAQLGGNRHPVMTTPYGESYPDWGNPVPEPPPPPKVYYVDAVNGNDNNNGLSRRTAFATIGKGIDSARNGFKVLVYPGVYQEEVDFKGKAITLQGVATKAGIPIIENPGDFAASIYRGEGPRAILKNFVVRGSFMAVFIAGSSPTLKNLNIIGNKYGIEAYAGSEPDISNCIFWENSDSDLFGCEARYSFVQRDIEPQSSRGLVAYWNFDEGSGTVAHDISGNNHNGTVYGATWVDGTSGKAMSFDGVDDYVMVPKENAPTRGPYGTVAGWVKIASTFQCPSEGVGFISKMLHSTGMYQYEISVYAGTSGPGHGCVGNGEGGCETCACVHWRDGQNIDPRLLFDDKWHHLSITWTPTVLTLYVDGIFENSVLHGRDLSIPDPMTWDLNIGRRAYSSAENWRYLQGHVDEVRIYNRALSIQEIQQLYRGQLGTSPLFADAANGDYHLLSERGRYWPRPDVWVLDKVTSPCVDGGDPNDDVLDEPMPNGGRIDMGAFGGTPFASMSDAKWLDGDINHDGIVNMIDLAMLAENWLRDDNP